MIWFRTASVAVCLLSISLTASQGAPAFAKAVATKQVAQLDEVRAAATILMDADVLAKTKMRVEKGDLELKPAMDQLIEDAEAALLDGPYSVTNKEHVPPSGDKHDYASYGRYWWPDPEQPDGLPYIRRDGETNPDSPEFEEIGPAED